MYGFRWRLASKLELDELNLELKSLQYSLSFHSFQDQIGGIYGGFKITTALNKLPIELNVKQLNLREDFLNLINKRLILIYTGITRLAKDLLLNVIRNWYAISEEIYENVQALVKNAHECSVALETGNFV